MNRIDILFEGYFLPSKTDVYCIFNYIYKQVQEISVRSSGTMALVDGIIFIIFVILLK